MFRTTIYTCKYDVYCNPRAFVNELFEITIMSQDCLIGIKFKLLNYCCEKYSCAKPISNSFISLLKKLFKNAPEC